MSPIVVQTCALSNIIRMGVVDEILYLFTVFLLILSLVFVVDLGLDIEEGIAPVALAFSTMTL